LSSSRLLLVSCITTGNQAGPAFAPVLRDIVHFIEIIQLHKSRVYLLGIDYEWMKLMPVRVRIHGRKSISDTVRDIRRLMYDRRQMAYLHCDDLDAP
jgi:hypothetical protein